MKHNYNHATQRRFSDINETLMTGPSGPTMKVAVMNSTLLSVDIQDQREHGGVYTTGPIIEVNDGQRMP